MDDLAMKREVEAELRYEPSTDAAGIGVAVKDGVVTLTGRVATYAQRMAARAVRYLRGVKGIINHISVQPAVTAAVVKAQIEAALKRRAELDAQRITVETRTTP